MFVVLRASLIAAVLAGPAWGGGAFPMAALQPYAEFRSEMIKAGWQPVDHGPTEAATAMAYPATEAFPEVKCEIYNRCFAEWYTGADWPGSENTLTFSVWYDFDGSVPLRVAPAF